MVVRVVEVVTVVVLVDNSGNNCDTRCLVYDG